MLNAVGVTVTVQSSLHGSSTIEVTVTVGSVSRGRVIVAFWNAVVVRVVGMGTVVGMMVGMVVGMGISRVAVALR